MDDILIPEDFKDFEPKLIANFTVRQTLLLAPAIALAILFKSVFNDELFIILTGIVFTTVFAFGWAKPYNMKFEDFLATSVVKMFLSPQRRLYKTENLHRVILEVDTKWKANETKKAAKGSKKNKGKNSGKGKSKKAKKAKESKNSKKKNRRRLDV